MSLADGFIVVYSITSADSLRKARRLVRNIRERNMSKAPIVLLGNKRDLQHHRQVSRDKAANTAKKLRCNLFTELSVAKDISAVRNIFCELYRRIEKRNRKQVIVERTRKNSALFVMMRAFSTMMNNVRPISGSTKTGSYSKKDIITRHSKGFSRLPSL